MGNSKGVRAVVSQTLGKVTKRDILAKCPDISEAMVEVTLRAMLSEGKIRKTRYPISAPPNCPIPGARRVSA